MNRLLLAMMAITITVTPAIAQPVDPDPDGMSIYFDTEGTQWCLDVPPWEPAVGAGPTITAYLLVTRPSTPHPTILAWEAHVEIITNSHTPPLQFNHCPGAVDYDSDYEDYVVGCACPELCDIVDDLAMIAWVDIAWLGLEGQAEATFVLRGVDGSISFPDGPGYAAAILEPLPCQPLFGTWGEVAWVNGGCQTISSEEMAWGMVKSLY